MRTFAMAFVQDAVERQIPNPHVADFNFETYRQAGENYWRIAGYGDTQNIFGGPHRFQFNGLALCTPTEDGREWRVEELNVE